VRSARAASPARMCENAATVAQAPDQRRDRPAGGFPLQAWVVPEEPWDHVRGAHLPWPQAREASRRQDRPSNRGRKEDECLVGRLEC
jgi:hypothetical protein